MVRFLTLVAMIQLIYLTKLSKLIEIYGSGSFEIIPFPVEKKRIDIGEYYADYSKFAALYRMGTQKQLKRRIYKDAGIL